MAMILDAFVGRFSDLLAQLIHDEVTMLLGVSDEIDKLQRTLNIIGRFLVDAERKRVEDDAVNHWIKQLKDAMYDADDILDECRIEAAKLVGSTTTTKASSSSSSTALLTPSFIRISKCDVELAEKIRTREEKEWGKIRNIPNIKVLDTNWEVVWERRDHEESH